MSPFGIPLGAFLLVLWAMTAIIALRKLGRSTRSEVELGVGPELIAVHLNGSVYRIKWWPCGFVTIQGSANHPVRFASTACSISLFTLIGGALVTLSHSAAPRTGESGVLLLTQPSALPPAYRQLPEGALLFAINRGPVHDVPDLVRRLRESGVTHRLGFFDPHTRGVTIAEVPPLQQGDASSWFTAMETRTAFFVSTLGAKSSDESLAPGDLLWAVDGHAVHQGLTAVTLRALQSDPLVGILSPSREKALSTRLKRSARAVTAGELTVHQRPERSSSLLHALRDTVHAAATATSAEWRNSSRVVIPRLVSHGANVAEWAVNSAGIAFLAAQVALLFNVAGARHAWWLVVLVTFLRPGFGWVAVGVLAMFVLLRAWRAERFPTMLVGAAFFVLHAPLTLAAMRGALCELARLNGLPFSWPL